MRPRWLWAFMIAMVLSAAARAFGGGYEWGGFGGRSGSMGGAFIGLADDWTANYWNPAGLAQLRGSEIGIDLLSPHLTIRGSDSFANLPPSPETGRMYRFTHDVFINYTGMEPDRFDKTSSSSSFYHPSGLGGYYSLPWVTLGAAVYSPLGYYSDWDDTIPFGLGSIYARNYQELVIVATQFSAAKEILPGLYAGAGASLLYDRLSRQSEKIVSGAGPLDYRYDFTMKNDGYGAEGTFGLLYEIVDWLSLGAVYRTGATVSLTGRTESSLTLMGLEESSAVTQKFRHPPTWGLGIAAQPLPGLMTVTADWQRTDWSFYRTNVSFERDGILFQSESYDEDWLDSNRYRFGVEYLLSAVALRGGFMYDESPLPDKSVSSAHIPDVNRKAVSLGAGHQLTDNWRLDAMGAYAWGKRTAREEEFEQKIWALSLGSVYSF